MPALVLIDLQKAIDHPQWRQHGDRNNPQAEHHVALLLAAWRSRNRPVYHVRHDSRLPDSPYRAGQESHAFQLHAMPLAGEPIIAKQVNSAFIGTGFEQQLRQAQVDTLVMAGVITNNSVEATVRMAGNLGFQTYLVEDACYTFARSDRTGRIWTADEVHALSIANLHGEYCTAITTEQALRLVLDV